MRRNRRPLREAAARPYSGSVVIVGRRDVLRLLASLPGLGLCGCAAAGPGAGPAAADTVPPGPRYEGPLVDCHSHVITRTLPGPGVSGLDEPALVRVLGEHGVEAVVGFGAAAGRTEGGRLVPVLALGGGALPARGDLVAALGSGDYRGLKMSIRHFPFPMQPAGVNGRADTGAIKEVATAAAQARSPFTLHVDGPDVEDLARLCAAVPDAPIVWAHAGATPRQFGGGATPVTVGRMLDRYPGLSVDLSARAAGWMGPLGPVAPGQPLLPAEWRAIMLRHPSRVLFGIDLFMTRFVPSLPGAVAYWRRVLGELPADVAEQIAHRNARRLYRL